MDNIDTSFNFLIKAIEEQQELTSHAILSGNMNESEYKRLCGVIQGLNFTKYLIKDLASKLEET
jgi:hypothetical protein